MKNYSTSQPDWICFECGMRLGRRRYGGGEMKASTWHEGTCDVCGKITSVTEPRDFGGIVREELRID